MAGSLAMEEENLEPGKKRRLSLSWENKEGKRFAIATEYHLEGMAPFKMPKNSALSSNGPSTI